MNVTQLAHRSKQIFSDNSPIILTATAITGTIATAVLAARGGYKAGYEVAHDEARGGVKGGETKREYRARITKTTWKLYLPTAATGVGTIACIAAANRISTNRTAALAAAYTITDRAYSEYKAKVVETMGERKEQTEVADKIMQDRVNDTGDRSSMVVISNNDVLCYDAFTDRYFQSSMEALKKAQNDTNYEILHNMYVSLSEFYSRIGLAPTSYSDDIGWNSDNQLDLQFSSVMTPDQRPALAFNFRVDPVRGFSKVHPS